MLKRFKQHAKDKLHIGEKSVTFKESEMPSKSKESPAAGLTVLREDGPDDTKDTANGATGPTQPRANHHTWPNVFTSSQGKRRSVSLLLWPLFRFTLFSHHDCSSRPQR
ncbi:hypothetical protein E2C01_080233 [Portunus trituberculatus]|uniref:Uncharacterized protein n=1 Tax=Portunus trituberculatus TaxID=210409 RepID=A0A5B7ISM1_PORTR|nr:hypothetical protein [Portunus trituberculatus]